ncbi:hypothetical protein WK25_01565 [Burkholderia latens]|nr:hypothetical protein WK25_01565 [Burkholderia latens]
MNARVRGCQPAAGSAHAGGRRPLTGKASRDGAANGRRAARAAVRANRDVDRRQGDSRAVT